LKEADDNNYNKNKDKDNNSRNNGNRNIMRLRNIGYAYVPGESGL
jgi:hypothetical protein